MMIITGSIVVSAIMLRRGILAEMMQDGMYIGISGKMMIVGFEGCK